MPKSRFLTTLLLAATLGLPWQAGPARADTLDMHSVGEDPAGTASMPRPHRGMTMDAVRREFGDPVTEHPPVGDPPITRWDYGPFSVFFEHQYVIHSVMHGDYAGK